ncbi:hypothetical protein [Paenibacillus larvae]|uniref:hypothetical protein n=1 Tax=Paenibacillus larvae TaxID=1464 RepID=UPI001F2DD664|nr:hypothetical protein [Paenibacillus larvae]
MGGGEKGTKKSHLTLMILAAVLVGAALMILSSFMNVKDISHYNEGRGSPRKRSPNRFFPEKKIRRKTASGSMKRLLKAV